MDAMTGSDGPGLGSGALREALAELFELVESGELVRDISRDGEGDWLRRLVKLTATLKKAQEALSLSSPIEPPTCTCNGSSNEHGCPIHGEFYASNMGPQASSEIREALLGRLIECVAPCLSAPNSGFNEVKLRQMFGKALAPSRQGAGGPLKLKEECSACGASAGSECLCEPSAGAGSSTKS